MAYVAA